MNADTLRTMNAAELDALLRRLERQVRDIANASTALGRKLHLEYQHVLALVRTEIEARACD